MRVRGAWCLCNARVPRIVSPQVLTLLFPKYCTEGAQIDPQPSDYDRLFDNQTRQMTPLSPEHPAVRSSAHHTSQKLRGLHLMLNESSHPLVSNAQCQTAYAIEFNETQKQIMMIFVPIMMGFV